MPTAMTMTAFVTTLFEVVEPIMDTVVEICQTVVSEPMLLFTTGFLFVGGCIGLFGRLLSRN